MECLSAGVAVGAFVVETSVKIGGSGEIAADDFKWAFVVVGLISSTSVLFFMRLPHDAGSEMAGRIENKPEDNQPPR